MYPDYLVTLMHTYMSATNPQEIDKLYAELEDEVELYHAESGMDREAGFTGEGWGEELLAQVEAKYGPTNPDGNYCW